MATINAEFEYKGYKVRYSDNDDSWNCSDLEIWNAKTPQAVARRIDAIMTKKRKTIENVDSILIDFNGAKKPVQIIGIAKTSRYDEARGFFSVWISEDKRRKKAETDKLIDLDHPDTAARLMEHEAALTALKKAEKAHRAAHAAIPRIDPAKLPMKEIEE